MNESDPSLVATAVSSATTKKNEDVENETGQTGTVSQTDECIGSHQQSVALGHDNQVVSTVHHSTETAEHTFLFRVDVDIVQEILLFLRFTELARLRRICRSFQWVCQSNVVWDRRYMVIQTANRVTGPGNHTPFEHSLWTIYQEQMNLALSMGLLRSSGPYGRYFSAIAAMFTSNVFTHFLCCCTDTLSKIKLGIRELEKSLRSLIRKAEQEVRALRETESKLTGQRSILSRQGQRMKQCLGLLQREPDCTSLMREVEGATPETLDALCASFSSSLEHEGMEPIRIIPDRNAVPLSPEAERAAQLVANSDTDARAAATVQELESYRTRIANLSALNKMFSIYAANLEEQNRLEQCIVNIKIQLHATIEYQTRLDHMLQHQLGYLLHVQLKEQAIRNTYQWQLHVMAIIDTRT